MKQGMSTLRFEPEPSGFFSSLANECDVIPVKGKLSILSLNTFSITLKDGVLLHEFAQVPNWKYRRILAPVFYVPYDLYWRKKLNRERKLLITPAQHN